MIPAALALALAAAPVTSFAKTKAVEATGIADENGFVSQPGNEYDDVTMKKLADNVLEYDEIGKLVEVYSPTFKTLKETYSDKKDASKDVAKLKSQLSDKSASILDAADQMNGMTDQMKDLTLESYKAQGFTIGNEAQKLQDERVWYDKNAPAWGAGPSL